MLKDGLIFATLFVLGLVAGFASSTYNHPQPVATNGRYVGVVELNNGSSQAIAFKDKEACENAATKVRALAVDPANAEAVAQAGGKIWLMPCTPVNSELITK